MTQDKSQPVFSVKGLSAIENNGVTYICLPRDYVVSNGIRKGTIMEFQYSGGIICYKPMRSPVSDTSTTSTLPTNIAEDNKKWEQISALPPNMVHAVLKRIDELTDYMDKLAERIDRIEIARTLEKKASER